MMKDPKPQTPGPGSLWKYWGLGQEHTFHPPGPLSTHPLSHRESSGGQGS